MIQIHLEEVIKNQVPIYPTKNINSAQFTLRNGLPLNELESHFIQSGQYRLINRG